MSATPKPSVNKVAPSPPEPGTTCPVCASAGAAAANIIASTDINSTNLFNFSPPLTRLLLQKERRTPEGTRLSASYGFAVEPRP